MAGHVDRVSEVGSERGPAGSNCRFPCRLRHLSAPKPEGLASKDCRFTAVGDRVVIGGALTATLSRVGHIECSEDGLGSFDRLDHAGSLPSGQAEFMGR